MRDVIQFIVYTHLFEEDKIRKTGPPLARRTKEGSGRKRLSVYLYAQRVFRLLNNWHIINAN